MLFAEPSPTQFDVCFRVGRIPVRVHPMFWLFGFLLGPHDPTHALIWVGALFISILIHELGHAFVVRAFGWWPHVVLYSFGGLAVYRPTHYDPRKQILISLAGPGADFLLALLVVAILKVTGNHVEVFWLHGILPMVVWASLPFDHPNLIFFVNALFIINIYWGILNLLPILPLDGGQVLHDVLRLVRTRDPTRQALGVSIVCAAAVAVYGIAIAENIFTGLMFAYLAYTNYQMLQAMSGGWRQW